MERAPSTTNDTWTQPVSVIRGVGPTRAEQLARLGIRTVEDLLLTLPVLAVVWWAADFG